MTYNPRTAQWLSLMFENGAMATVDTYFCIPDNSSKNMLELYGSKGSILAKGTIGQGDAGEMIAYLETDDAGYDAEQKRDMADGLVISPDPINTYQAEIDEFSKAILEGRVPENNALIGLQNQRMIEACYKSARSGKVVEL